MRRLLLFLIAVSLLAGCGNDGTSDAGKSPGPGTDPKANSATATQYFEAVASKDLAKVEAAFDLAAPDSPAQSYLQLVAQGLEAGATADTMTVTNGRYKLCLADSPQTCHTFAAIVLADGRVNDFTIDGKKIRLR